MGELLSTLPDRSEHVATSISPLKADQHLITPSKDIRTCHSPLSPDHSRHARGCGFLGRCVTGLGIVTCHGLSRRVQMWTPMLSGGGIEGVHVVTTALGRMQGDLMFKSDCVL